MPWCCGIAVPNSSNRLERLQQKRGLIVFRVLGWIDRCWIDRVMNRPQDEPTVLNRPVMKRPGITSIDKKHALTILDILFNWLTVPKLLQATPGTKKQQTLELLQQHEKVKPQKPQDDIRDLQEVIIVITSISVLTDHRTRLIWRTSSCQSWTEVKFSRREIVRRKTGSNINLLLSWRASCKVSGQVEMTRFCLTPTLSKPWSQLKTVPVNCHLTCQRHARMMMIRLLFFCVLQLFANSSH